VDAFLSMISHVESDKELTKKKFILESESIKAAKVITKYNENSHRVIGFANIKRAPESDCF